MLINEWPLPWQGRQEDAEEYLGFTLNGLHEEMLALKKLISPQEDSKTPHVPSLDPETCLCINAYTNTIQRADIDDSGLLNLSFAPDVLVYVL